MQKKIIAMAVAGLVSGAAFAASNVTVYGIIDVGYANASSNQTGSKSLVQSGMLSDNRLGFKGTEDLGGGLKANFVLETALSADTPTTSTTRLGDRSATVGLSGGFGAINMGRQYTPIFNVIAASDVSINTAIVSDLGQMEQVVRSNNSIKYTSPSFGGFTVQAIWAAGENLATKSAGDEMGFSAAYAAGPLSIGLAQHQVKNATNTSKNKDTAFGLTYDLKVVKLFGLYTTNKQTDGTDKDRHYQIQAAFGAGPGTAVVSYFNDKDKVAADNDSRGFGVAYLYPLSKRTTAYAAWGKRTNEANSFSALNKGVGAATAGYDPKLLGIGLRHTF